jgi:hypothetical protein
MVKMAYKLQTKVGKAIYRLRKCTVEPVIGIIKEVLGFRQFSLRGLEAAAGEMVSGLPGLQSQTAARADGRIGLEVISTRLSPESQFVQGSRPLLLTRLGLDQCPVGLHWAILIVKELVSLTDC